MKSNYAEKKQNRIAAYNNLAVKNSVLATTKINHAINMTKCIPMGQPILIGHHSEKGHRALLNRSDNAMRLSVQASKKAEYYADKAATAANNNAISSDDENAIELLKEKLAKLEKKQEFMKAVNKAVKKANAAELLAVMGIKEALINELLNPKYSYESKGFQSYELTNNNAKIKAAKDRIAKLEKMATFDDVTTVINNVKLVAAASENRIQIFFPDKPNEAIIAELKSNGFRWAPSVNAWMRFYGSWAWRIAKEIAAKY